MRMRPAVTIFLLVVSTSTSCANHQDEGEYEPRKGKFLFVRKTEIITSLITTTATVGATCRQADLANVAPGGVLPNMCLGRRRRRGLKSASTISESELFDLEGSLSSETEAIISDTDVNKGKMIIWTTTQTKIQITTRSEMAGNTLTVAFSCTAEGMNLPPLCG